jgi:hypothetical protein
MGQIDHRAEVREFLSSRRARITPEQAGLPAYGGNRRVKGLRREEVAMLAGVSIDYYVRMERGNLAGASEGVLDALARALRLDEAERDHLFLELPLTGTLPDETGFVRVSPWGASGSAADWGVPLTDVSLPTRSSRRSATAPGAGFVVDLALRTTLAAEAKARQEVWGANPSCTARRAVAGGGDTGALARRRALVTSVGRTGVARNARLLGAHASVIRSARRRRAASPATLSRMRLAVAAAIDASGSEVLLVAWMA